MQVKCNHYFQPDEEVKGSSCQDSAPRGVDDELQSKLAEADYLSIGLADGKEPRLVRLASGERNGGWHTLRYTVTVQYILSLLWQLQ